MAETQTQQITASQDYRATGNNSRLLIMFYLLGLLLNTGVSSVAVSVAPLLVPSAKPEAEPGHFPLI